MRAEEEAHRQAQKRADEEARHMAQLRAKEEACRHTQVPVYIHTAYSHINAVYNPTHAHKPKIISSSLLHAARLGGGQLAASGMV